MWDFKSFTKFSGAVVDFLSIPRGSTLSSYLQIWLAFTASGIMHAQSMLLLPHPGNITLSERTLGVLLFFVWQAVAITVEDSLQYICRLYAPAIAADHPRITRTLGYLWVILSFWVSLPWAADVMMRLRLTERSFLGFSVSRDLVRRIPIPS